jgi:radical SAM ThiC family protein
MRVQPI